MPHSLDGRARKEPCSPNPHLEAFARSGVYFLDRMLRSVLGIIEFCDSDLCILRIRFRRARSDMDLGEGTRINKSEELIELHFWNEHLPSVRDFQSPFGWAVRFRARMRNSLSLLAAHVERDPKMQNVTLFGARLVLPLDGRWMKCACVAEDFGFAVSQLPRTLSGRFHDTLENFLIYALVWAFHPRKIRRRRAALERVHWWISRKELLDRYRDTAREQTEVARTE